MFAVTCFAVFRINYLNGGNNENSPNFEELNVSFDIVKINVFLHLYDLFYN